MINMLDMFMSTKFWESSTRWCGGHTHDKHGGHVYVHHVYVHHVDLQHNVRHVYVHHVYVHLVDLQHTKAAHRVWRRLGVANRHGSRVLMSTMSIFNINAGHRLWRRLRFRVSPQSNTW
jgi:hypothetical protein